MRGIEMIKDNRKRTISVKKELILSGGAVNSPVLLMLSGIGPKQHLQELEVWLSLNYILFAFDLKT